MSKIFPCSDCTHRLLPCRHDSQIYIWNRDNGNLIIHLKGPMSSILDLQWHPARPIIASTSQQGNVIVWSKQYSENYSAFAPNFQELEENEEYIEREDEFDLVEDKEAKTKQQLEDESGDVDVTTIEEQVCLLTMADPPLPPPLGDDYSLLGVGVSRDRR